MGPTTRPANPQDAEAISDTVAIGFDGYRELAAPGWQPPDATSPEEVARVRARLLEPDTWGLVAEEAGQTAAHVAFTPQQGVPGSAHLWMLFVRPPWWGTGLATELLGAAVAEARARGYIRMRFLTPRDQRRARAFYEREGFAFTGTESFEVPIGLVLVEYAREPL